jgi:two-component system response regulator HydG
MSGFKKTGRPGKGEARPETPPEALEISEADCIRLGEILKSTEAPVRVQYVSPQKRALFGQVCGRTLHEVARAMIVVALERCHGNKTAAAELLGMPLRTLRNRLTQYGLEEWKGKLARQDLPGQGGQGQDDDSEGER